MLCCGASTVNVLNFPTLYSILFWPKFCCLCSCFLKYLVEWQAVQILTRSSLIGSACLHMPLCQKFRVRHFRTFTICNHGQVVQSVVSLTSLLRVISLTVLVESKHNILIFFAEKNVHCKSYSHFFSKKFQHICVSLDVNFNKLLTNDVVSFEQLGPEELLRSYI